MGKGVVENGQKSSGPKMISIFSASFWCKFQVFILLHYCFLAKNRFFIEKCLKPRSKVKGQGHLFISRSFDVGQQIKSLSNS